MGKWDAIFRYAMRWDRMPGRGMHGEVVGGLGVCPV
jgi:hypothetical protein